MLCCCNFGLQQKKLYFCLLSVRAESADVDGLLVAFQGQAELPGPNVENLSDDNKLLR